MDIWRLLGLREAGRAERRATFWVGVMFFASLAATFLLRPLRDQFGVDRGVGELPYLYSLTLLATVVLVLPFWWLADRMPSRRFVPLILHVFTGLLVALALGLAALGGYDWSEALWLGEVFWGGFSALNVAVPALVWIHAVEHFDRAQAGRAFGLVAVGGTLGALFGSWAAGLLADQPVWTAGVGAAALLQVAHLAFRRSMSFCDQLEGGAARAGHARGGMLEGLQIVARDARARWICFYMLLFGVVGTAFYAAQTELLGEELEAAQDQRAWLADVEVYSQGFVLLLQVFCTGRLLKVLPAAALLVSLPVVSMLGLYVWWLAPTAASIFFVQVARRGARFALEKPAREVLYTPFDLATKHKVKFLLDTFAYRLGDLLGAFLQVGLRDLALGTGAIVAVTVGVAALSIFVAVGIARGQRASSPIS